MIRKGSFKYVHYVGMPPQLFDLAADPQETRDLAQEAGYAGLVADCERELRGVVDPEAADALAKGGPARPHRRLRRARGDHRPRQLRLFADPGHQAGVQLTIRSR
jgi:arylsulfatase A-like enzyme